MIDLDRNRNQEPWRRGWCGCFNANICRNRAAGREDLD